ncbi:MAG: hypothetical protein RMI34_07365 [Chloroherpetonaceae bacterium]|nr:hypothetical protein [Chloroherpetonaceae bacterium]MCS7210130.1 hypothetical protein [Chloroherpetonaceae bacterium]MDW8019878.1 hypothetical protein [Chloroherpetonaceae bacterium]MDW8467066.1 hypothetical protein [Chloroherpetonaceae bacterium]
MKQLFFLGSAMAVLSAVVATDLSAQIRPDARLGIYTNGGNFSLGAGVAVPVKVPGFGTLSINPTADYIFISSPPGGSALSIFVHGDVAYIFDIPKSPIAPYAGAGLLIAFSSVSVDVPTFGGGTQRQTSSSTNAGLNLFGGAEFPVGPVAIYAQAKLLISSGTNFQIGGGVRF